MKGLSIVFIVLLFSNVLSVHAQSNTNTDSVRIKKMVLQSVSKFEKVGFIKKIDGEDQKIYLDDTLWYMENGPQKENIVKILAYYMGITFSHETQLMPLSICSYQSGKVLATYGIFNGVEIK